MLYLWTLLAGLLIALLPLSACVGADDFALNVRQFGAKGDGTTDDTAAFQKALDKTGRAGGGIVRVPVGNYLIKTHLDIPRSVTLEGVWTIPHVAIKMQSANPKFDQTWLSGSVLLAVEGAGKATGTPFISLHSNSTVKGLTIYYPQQKADRSPTPYPWTIASAGGDNTSILDCLLVNPYQAVDFGTHPAGRHYIRNLYGQPLFKGLFIDKCFDVGRCENIHFWPFWTGHVVGSPNAADDWVLQNGTAFILGRSDWEYVTNCFAISYKVGMHFLKISDPGPGNYLLTQSGADCSDIAVLAEETQGHSGISFVNSQIFGRIVIGERNNGPIRFTACGLFGASGKVEAQEMIKIDGRGKVSFENCSFYAIDPNPKCASLIHAAGGRLGISNCTFINCRNTMQDITPIVLDEGVVSAMIAHNEFYGSKQIVNNAKRAAIIESNLFGTDEQP